MSEKSGTTATTLQNGDIDNTVPEGKYKVVVYDFETTGKSLQDEICHIGCFAPNSEGDGVKGSKDKGEGNGAKEGAESQENGEAEGTDGEGEEKSNGFQYSQYIMPYRNVSFSARNAYGLAVVSMDYQRMLRDLNTGKLLKTKSEISALKDWMKWLVEVKGDSEGIILVHHAYEETRDLQVPQLLLSLNRYNLFQQFTNIVKGFCNSVNVISDLGDKSAITSLSLRSLCKTVLKNPSLPTKTAQERCTRIHDVLVDVVSGPDNLVQGVRRHARNPAAELANLRRLEGLQSAQYSMRPIFAEAFSDGYKTRARMVGIRRNIAEHGLDYAKLTELYKEDKLASELEKVEVEDEENKTLMLDTVITHFKQIEVKEKSSSEAAVSPAGDSN